MPKRGRWARSAAARSSKVSVVERCSPLRRKAMSTASCSWLRSASRRAASLATRAQASLKEASSAGVKPRAGTAFSSASHSTLAQRRRRGLPSITGASSSATRARAALVGLSRAASCPALAAAWAGWQPHDSRTTSSVASVIRRAEPPPFQAATIRPTASIPMRTTGCLTVVSAGRAMRALRASSKPATTTSSGQTSPAAKSAA